MRNQLMKFVFMILLLLPVHAMADTIVSPGVKPAPVSYSAIPGKPSVAKGSLLQRVQGGYCRACRLDCSAERYECYDYETERFCRRQFTRCMRRCWYRYCR